MPKLKGYQEFIDMPTCPKCGAEVEKGAEYCRSCGTRLIAETGKPLEKEGSVRERDVCFGEGERRTDYSGFVSFGILLLVVGITFLANPNLISDFRFWIETMTTRKTLSRPPQGLIDSAALFFGLVAISNFVMVIVRFFANERMRRVLAGILSGVALALFSYFIYLYGTHTFAWTMVLAAEAVTVGLLVILYSVLRYLFPKKL
jgi:uncharacterized membrane protein HdeD (DUF308 family)